MRIHIFYLILLTFIGCKTVKYPYDQRFISFYKSDQDFKEKKPAYKYPIIADTTEHGLVYFYDNLKVKDKNKVRMITADDFPMPFFSDNDRLLLRYYKGKYFVVLVSGDYGYYMDYAHTTILDGPDGKIMTISNNPQDNTTVLHYFSKGEFGDIEPLTNVVLYPLLDQYHLTDQYQQKKKDIGLREYSGEFSEVYMDIFKLINHKLK